MAVLLDATLLRVQVALVLPAQSPPQFTLAGDPVSVMVSPDFTIVLQVPVFPNPQFMGKGVPMSEVTVPVELDVLFTVTEIVYVGVKVAVTVQSAVMVPVV